MTHLTTEAIDCMDDMAAYAFDNVTSIARATESVKTPDQCYTALQQSLAHYRAAGKMTPPQAIKQTLLTRAAFFRSEAEMMLDEQWEAYGTEVHFDNDYRPSRTKPADVSECMGCWELWDADGYKLYQALLHRAELLGFEAQAVKS